MIFSVERHDSSSRHSSPDNLNRFGGRIDPLDEELDYDETMEDIEQYLREDDDDTGGTCTCNCNIFSVYSIHICAGSVFLPEIRNCYQCHKPFFINLAF